MMVYCIIISMCVIEGLIIYSMYDVWFVNIWWVLVLIIVYNVIIICNIMMYCIDICICSVMYWLLIYFIFYESCCGILLEVYGFDGKRKEV